MSKTKTKELTAYIDSIHDKELRQDVRNYISYYYDEYLTFPASISFHHTYRGGFLDHILEVCYFSMRLIDVVWESTNEMNDVNRDYVLASALIHDMSKLGQEYVWNESASRFEKTHRMEFVHDLFPVMDWERKLDKSMPEPMKLMVMSHMGGWSQTGVFPDNMECAVLQCADMLSSRLKNRRELGRAFRSH